MAKVITPQYFNEQEQLFDQAKYSELYNESDFSSIQDTQKLDYAKLLVNSMYTSSEKFDKDMYDAFTKSDTKMAYLWHTYYEDENSETFADNEKYFDQEYQRSLDERFYNNLNWFAKAAFDTADTILTIGNAAVELVAGLEYLGRFLAVPLTNIGSEWNELDRKYKEIMEQPSVTSLWGLLQTSSTDALAAFRSKYTAYGKGGFQIFGKNFTEIKDDLLDNATRMSVNFIPGAGQFLYFGSMAGQTAKEVSTLENINYGSAFAYTALTTLVEFGTEKLVGDFVFGEGLINPDKLLASRSLNTAGRILSKMGLTFAGEAAEEMLAEVLDWGLDRIILGKDETLSMDQVLYAGLTGGLLGLLGESLQFASVKGDGTLRGKFQAYSKLIDYKANMSALESLVKENSNIGKLMKEKGISNESELASKFKNEYDAAAELDKEKTIKIGTYVKALTEIGESVGTENMAKADELLRQHLEQLGKEARYADSYNSKTQTKKFKETVDVYNKYSVDGTKIDVVTEFTPTQQAFVKNVNSLFPNMELALVNVFSDNGAAKPSWNGMVIRENVMFVDADYLATHSQEDVFKLVVSHELIHTFQRVGSILSPEMMDELDRVMSDAGLVIDYDSIEVSGINAEGEYKKNLTRAEKQALFYSENLLFNPKIINTLYITNKGAFSKIYKWLGNTAKFTTSKGVKGKIKLNTLFNSMELYRQSIAQTIRNDLDANTVSNELNFTQQQKDKLLATYYVGKNDLNNHWILSGENMNVTVMNKLKVTDELGALRVNPDTSIIFDWSRIADYSYYNPNAIKQLLGEGVTVDNFAEKLNDKYLKTKNLMYHIPTKTVIKTTEFTKHLSSKGVRTVNNVIESGALLSKIFYEKANIDELGNTLDFYFNENTLKDEINFVYLNDRTEIVFDALPKGTLGMTKATDYGYDTFTGKEIALSNRITIDIQQIIENTKTSDDAVTEFYNTLEHELSHAMASLDGLALGSSDVWFENTYLKNVPDEAIRKACELRNISLEGNYKSELASDLYELTAGEKNAELKRKGFGSYKSENSIVTFYENGEFKVVFEKDLQPLFKILEPYVDEKFKSDEVYSAKITIGRSEILNSMFETLKTDYNLKTITDLENFGFSETFLEAVEKQTLKKSDIVDMIRTDTLFTSEVSDDIKKEISDKLIGIVSPKTKAKIGKKDLEETLRRKSDVEYDILTDIEQTTEEGEKLVETLEGEKDLWTTKEASVAQEFKDWVYESKQPLQKLETGIYGGKNAIERHIREDIKRVKNSRKVLDSIYRDLKEYGNFIGQNDVNEIVNTMNDMLKKAGKNFTYESIDVYGDVSEKTISDIDKEAIKNKFIEGLPENYTLKDIENRARNFNRTFMQDLKKMELPKSTVKSIQEMKLQAIKELRENVSRETIAKEPKIVEEKVEPTKVEEPTVKEETKPVEQVFEETQEKVVEKISTPKTSTSQRIIELSNLSNNYTSEIQGETAGEEYKRASTEVWKNNIAVFSGINSSNYESIRNEILQSGDKVALRVFDSYCYNFRGMFDTDVSKKIVNNWESVVKEGASYMGLQSAMLNNAKPATEIISAFGEDGIQLEVTNDMLVEADKRLAEKDKLIKELESEIENLKKELSEAEGSLEKQYLENELTKVSNSKYTLQNGSNVDIMDWIINEASLNDGVDIENSFIKKLVDILESAKKEGKTAYLYVDKNTGKKVSILKSENKAKIQKVLKKIKGFRNWALLSSPVTHARNWIGNKGMQGLDFATNTVEKIITNRLNFKEGQMKFQETKAGKDLYNYIDKTYGNSILAYVRGESAKYGEVTAEKAAQIKKEQRKAEYKTANWFQKLCIKAMDYTEWGLNTGPFGDEPTVYRNMIKNVADLIASNTEYLLKGIQSEYNLLSKRKILNNVNESRKEVLKKAIDSKSVIDIFNAVQKEEMKRLIDNAGQRSFEQFFKNKNALSTMLSNLSRKHPVVGELISWVIPFPKVAVNIMKMAYKYSPAQFINATMDLIRFKKKGSITGTVTGFEQATIVREYSQATVGTFLFLAGSLAAALGWVGVDDDDYLGPSFKFGDVKIGLSNLAPSMTTFSAASALIWAFKNNKNAVKEVLNVLYDNTLLNTVENVFKYSSPEEYIGNMSISYISQYIPAVIKYLNKSVLQTATKDKTGNYFEKLFKTLASYTPGLSMLVPDKINPYTGEKTYASGSANWLLNFLSGTSPLDVKFVGETEIEREAKRLGVNTTGSGSSYSINNKEYSIKGNSKIAKDRANYINKEFNKLMNSYKYSRMSDKDKETAIKSIYTKASNLAKINYWTSLGNVYVFTTQNEYNTYKNYLTNASNVRKKYSGYKGSKFVQR